ncbi:hypothetical protein BGZ52_007155 [Haplosporangium bisporale]|nr:hypothetical protein BGZ52_007155 [Haplosporangium bisporale]
MGVLGLYSYFESKSLGQRKNWTSNRSNSSTHSDNNLTKQRCFILDGNAFIHHLYCGGPFEWIWGGQYSAFANHLTAHVQALENAGFRLQFLFDGPLPMQKLQTRLTRDTEKIRKMTRVVNDLEHYYHGYSGMPGASHSLYDQPQQHHASGIPGISSSVAPGGGAGRSNSQFLIPPLVMEVTLQTLRSLGVELMVSITGMDRMKEAFHAGQFSYKLMDVVCNKMFWCTPFLEDTERESAWLASRELRRWIYGILFRNLLQEESKMNSLTLATPPRDSTDDESEGYESTIRDVVEYVRRGDHLSAETVTGASDLELDGVLEKSRQLQEERATVRTPMTPLAEDISSMVVDTDKTEKMARRVSVMDVDLEEDLGEPVSRDSLSHNNAEDQSPEMETKETSKDGFVETGDMASRTSMFLGILGSDTVLVRGLPKPFMVLAATLRYLVNALAHSKTRSASVSVANFEVIAFVATVLFIQERYHPESIASYQQQASRHIPTTTTAASTPSTPINTHSSTAFEAPPMTKRSLHLSTQYQHALGTVSLLANALHLEDMIPQMASLFDGLLFQQTLALARGGTSVEQRFQFPESMALYEEILAAVEEGFVDSGEIDVVVLFRPGNNKRRTRSLGIFGPDMDVLNPQAGLSSGASQSAEKASSSSATGNSLKASKSGIHKKSSGNKKRSKGTGGGSSSSRNGTGGGSVRTSEQECRNKVQTTTRRPHHPEENWHVGFHQRMGAYEAAKIANERAKELLQLIKPEPIDDQRSPLARRINALDADRGSIQEQKQNESSAQRVTHQEKENGVPLDGGKQRKKRKYKSIEKRKQSLAKEKGSLSQELDQNKLMLDVWKITMQEPITQVLSDMSKLNEDYFKGETAGEPAVESVIKTSTEEGPVNVPPSAISRIRSLECRTLWTWLTGT